jgi:5-formyltetrahydrofolate cyclo-ligase
VWQRMLDKKEYRNIVKNRRDIFFSAEKDSLDKLIYEKVITCEQFTKAKVVFIYVSYKNEVDTHNIINYALLKGKIVAVPKIVSVKEGMEAVRINSQQELCESPYGILEPSSFDNRIDIKSIDLVLAPGAAFDKRGGRIGYGAGMYDKFLVGLRKDAAKLALAYSFQVFDAVPMEDNDIYMDGIITEKL